MRLTDEQLDWLCARLPEPPARPKGGRPPMDRRRVIAAIFWILDNGAKWKDLPRHFGSRSAVHAYFQQWTRQGVFERILRDASNYYVLGYYSTNPDPTKRRRQVEVKLARKGLDVYSRKEYVLRAPRPSAPAAQRK